MEYIRTTKKLRTHRLYKEYREISHEYYLHSIRQEEKTNNYLKNKSVKHRKTGEVFNLSYDFEKEQRKSKGEMLQKIIHIEKMASDNGLKPLFLTLTLPSSFNPFISVGKKKKNRLYVDVNKNFMYRTLQNAIISGYEQLNKLFRAFYRQIKRYKFGNMIKYIKVYEPHASLQVHLHALFFIHPDDIEKVILYFQKFLEKQDIGRSELDTKIVSNINHVGSYISKYIYKNSTNEDDKYFSRFLDGWKKKNRIRMVSTSNIKINMLLYKKLYSSIPKDIKKEMLSISKYNKQTLLTTLLQRTEFNETITHNGSSKKTIKTLNNRSKFIIKYDKVIETKIVLRACKIREQVIRAYQEENITVKDGFMEEEIFDNPYASPEYTTYFGYITHTNSDEEIVETTAIKNIRIYYKNELLYNQSDYSLMLN